MADFVAPEPRPVPGPEHEGWRYGWYDSEDPGRVIYWYAFGFLEHETPESAEHTGRKSTTGHPVIVRRRCRRDGGYARDDWEHYVPADQAHGAADPPQLDPEARLQILEKQVEALRRAVGLLTVGGAPAVKWLDAEFRKASKG